jgi:hypothetical protein
VTVGPAPNCFCFFFAVAAPLFGVEAPEPFPALPVPLTFPLPLAKGTEETEAAEEEGGITSSRWAGGTVTEGGKMVERG